MLNQPKINLHEFCNWKFICDKNNFNLMMFWKKTGPLSVLDSVRIIIIIIFKYFISRVYLSFEGNWVLHHANILDCSGFASVNFAIWDQSGRISCEFFVLFTHYHSDCSISNQSEFEKLKTKKNQITWNSKLNRINKYGFSSIQRNE